MANVRAKFHVHNMIVHEWGTTVELSPVYSDDPNSENKKFWDATPNGSIIMHIKNEAAAQHFKENASYYVDFSEAPE